eukprot:TRINITY_DN7648_c0_g1_i1.p1 TRINITY_DN7648_c0_g1~~TRINITY_DN7648_c0_g1_i1.p1  ORF type:complete len:1560 (-),score=201.03 TRINITY_DN7648_c0_g1_i1:314-4993(-)
MDRDFFQKDGFKKTFKQRVLAGASRQTLVELIASKYSFAESNPTWHNFIAGHVSDTHTSDFAFLWEMLQNCDDNHFSVTTPAVAIRLQGTILEIACNEVGFAPKNVLALCSVNGSTKKKLKQGRPAEAVQVPTGEKGTGFKSVFQVAKRVDVYSIDNTAHDDRAFSFYLQSRPDSVAKIGFVYPYWDTTFAPSSKNLLREELHATQGTVMTLHLRDETVAAKICERLLEIRAESVVFLQQLRQISVCIGPVGQQRRFCFELDRTSSPDCWTVRHHNVLRRFHVHGEIVSMQGVQCNRRSSEQSCLTVLLPCRDGDVEQPGQLFAVLPTKVRISLPCLVNADFVLPSNRESLMEHEEWNKRLCAALPGTLASAVEAIARLSVDDAIAALRYIPTAVDDVYGLIQVTYEHIRQQLAEAKIVPQFQCGTEGLLLCARSCLWPDPTFYSLCTRNAEPSLVHPSFNTQQHRSRLGLLAPLQIASQRDYEGWIQAQLESDQHIHWFGRLFAFMRSQDLWRTPCSLDIIPCSLDIIPLDDATYCAPGQHVFISGIDTAVDELIRLVKYPIRCLDQRVLGSVSDDQRPHVLKWLVRQQQLTEITAQTVLDSICRWLDRECDSPAIQVVLIEATRKIAAIRASAVTLLPVKCTDGLVHARASIAQKVVVTEDNVYLLLFCSPSDQQRLCILDASYNGVPYLTHLGVHMIPTLPERLSWIASPPQVDEMAFAAQLERCTLLVSYFRDKDPRIFDAMSGVRPPAYFDEHAWLPTTDTVSFAKPGDIYVPSVSMRDMLQDKVPYLHESLYKAGIQDLCSVNKTADFADCEKRIREVVAALGSDCDRLVSALDPLLVCLARYHRHQLRPLKEVFSSRLLVAQNTQGERVIRDAAHCIVLPEGVSWAHMELGKYCVVNGIYSEQVDNQFLRTIGCRDSIPISVCLQSWRHAEAVAAKPGDQADRSIVNMVEGVVKTCYNRILCIPMSKWKETTWSRGWHELKLWTGRRFMTRLEVIYCDDQELLRKYAPADIPILWIPDSALYSEISARFDLRPLSKCHRVKLVPTGTSTSAERLMTPEVRYAIIAYVCTRFSYEIQNRSVLQRLQTLVEGMEVEEYEADELRVVDAIALFNDWIAESIDGRKVVDACFWPWDNRLYYNKSRVGVAKIVDAICDYLRLPGDRSGLAFFMRACIAEPADEVLAAVVKARLSVPADLSFTLEKSFVAPERLLAAQKACGVAEDDLQQGAAEAVPCEQQVMDAVRKNDLQAAILVLQQHMIQQRQQQLQQIKVEHENVVGDRDLDTDPTAAEPYAPLMVSTAPANPMVATVLDVHALSSNAEMLQHMHEQYLAHADAGELAPKELDVLMQVQQQKLRASAPRRKDYGFSERVRQIYDRCVVTGSTFEPQLDAAHIIPWQKRKAHPDLVHQTYNGLRLRADIHRLFDNKRLCFLPSGPQGHFVCWFAADVREFYSTYHLQPMKIRVPLTSVAAEHLLQWGPQLVGEPRMPVALPLLSVSSPASMSPRSTPKRAKPVYTVAQDQCAHPNENRRSWGGKNHTKGVTCTLCGRKLEVWTV